MRICRTVSLIASPAPICGPISQCQRGYQKRMIAIVVIEKPLQVNIASVVAKAAVWTALF
ncbi:hypothetical protein RRSWK_00551 [Rhodopirellula sp. SWK7]|nr:hypothetical protein RRSWK_00551 [Rhodopirellula sp. SWK7]